MQRLLGMCEFGELVCVTDQDGGGGSDPEHRKHGIQVRNAARDTEDTS